MVVSPARLCVWSESESNWTEELAGMLVSGPWMRRRLASLCRPI